MKPYEHHKSLPDGLLAEMEKEMIENLSPKVRAINEALLTIANAEHLTVTEKASKLLNFMSGQFVHNPEISHKINTIASNTLHPDQFEAVTIVLSRMSGKSLRETRRILSSKFNIRKIY